MGSQMLQMEQALLAIPSSWTSILANVQSIQAAISTAEVAIQQAETTASGTDPTPFMIPSSTDDSTGLLP
jgi:hypothetical protein